MSNNLRFFLCISFIFLNFSSFVHAENSGPFENNEYYFRAYYDDLLNPPFKMSFDGTMFYMDIPELDQAKLESGIYINGVIEGEYTLEKDNSFLYLHVNEKKYLALYVLNLLCILVDCSNNDTFFGINKNTEYIRLSDRIRGNTIGLSPGRSMHERTSSYLTETISNKKIEYNNESHYVYQVTSPWIEGVEGNGIGEWIEKEVFFDANEIVLFNGYINPNRQDLYFANSRVKEIEIINEGNNWTFTLEDTPNPQIIMLPEKITGTVRFVIKDVYEGNKYADTALGGIYFLRKYVEEATHG